MNVKDFCEKNGLGEKAIVWLSRLAYGSDYFPQELQRAIEKKAKMREIFKIAIDNSPLFFVEGVFGGNMSIEEYEKVLEKSKKETLAKIIKDIEDK